MSYVPPTISLPQPPAGRSGWPWDGAPPQAPPEPSGGWPTITVVTPSFNQGAFLEETLRSVLRQGYPRLEYLVVDGGSTDASVEILRRYEPWLTRWVSEPDRGQADALRKAYGWARGTWINWINSDDLLAPGALFRVARQGAEVDVVAGSVLDFDATGKETLVVQEAFERFLTGDPRTPFHQPGIWLRREHVEACGGIDPAYHYVFDFDLLMRYLAKAPRVAYVPEIMARFRLHGDSKTVSLGERFAVERRRLYAARASHADPRLAKACSSQLALIEWQDFCLGLVTSGASRPQKVASLAKRLLQEPGMLRLRLTWGCIRAIARPA